MPFIFGLFACLLVFSAIMVVLSRNPVYSVFFLIFVFSNASGLFILLGAELIAMVMLIVYVGAVAVFFLFVVMMLDVGTDSVKKLFPRNVFVLSILGVLIAVDIYALSEASDFAYKGGQYDENSRSDNLKDIGRVLYTDYFYVFQLIGVILLTAMVGAVALTLDQTNRSLRKSQSTFKQMSRDSNITTVDLR